MGHDGTAVRQSPEIVTSPQILPMSLAVFVASDMLSELDREETHVGHDSQREELERLRSGRPRAARHSLNQGRRNLVRAARALLFSVTSFRVERVGASGKSVPSEGPSGGRWVRPLRARLESGLNGLGDRRERAVENTR